MFISIAVQNFDYLSRQPETICKITPVMLQMECQNPKDLIRECGIFVCLGVLFAGISSGTSTFGKEKLAYWRDCGSGMPTLPYYLAKAISDGPRVLLAAILVRCIARDRLTPLKPKPVLHDIRFL